MLQWSPQLAKSANEYAKYLAEKGIFQHSNSSDGENLGKGYSSMEGATKAWLSEEKLYDGRGIDGSFGSYGHFTAVGLKAY